MSGEDELIKGVEEEVKKLLAERRITRMQKKHVLSIYYFGSPDEVREEDLRREMRGGVVMIALKDNSPENARKFLENISTVVKQAGGTIYLIKSPSILIISDLARLEIRADQHQP